MPEVSVEELGRKVFWWTVIGCMLFVAAGLAIAL